MTSHDNIPHRDQSSEFHWRPATREDLATIDEIGTQVHAGLPERYEVFQEKFRLCPEGWFALEKAGRVVGYGIAHTWRLYSIPPLDSFLGTLPTEANCLFVHDVALLPEARGRNVVKGFLGLAEELASEKRLTVLAGVSVYGTCPLWCRYGFVPVEEDAFRAKLASYGEDAKYLVRRLV